MIWPFALYFLIVMVLVGGILVVSYLLGQRHSDRATTAPYESGIVTQGDARARFSAWYYLIAVFFVVFDIEAAFLFAWAVAARDSGWAGYGEASLFVAVLIIGLIYLARAGGLDWAPRAPKSR